ncbi:MAG: hypothetical protein KAH32_00090 [Chlamydiia bacterium]|nr:hypothetical protein [Chlamydiia bacterium]
MDINQRIYDLAMYDGMCIGSDRTIRYVKLDKHKYKYKLMCEGINTDHIYLYPHKTFILLRVDVDGLDDWIKQKNNNRMLEAAE